MQGKHTLLYRLDPGGSTRYTRIPGSLPCRCTGSPMWRVPMVLQVMTCSDVQCLLLPHTLRYCDTPAIVPPVPAPDTNASALPPVCSHISLPVSRCALHARWPCAHTLV